MLLDEAIKHAEEVARKEQEKGFDSNTYHNCETEYGRKCYKCAAEHRQLAEWLKDYKRLLGVIEDIKAELSDHSMKLQTRPEISYDSAFADGLDFAVTVIDKHISGKERT